MLLIILNGKRYIGGGIVFVFVPKLFMIKCNSKLLWRLGSLNGVREAVPCSMEEKTVLVACGAYFGKGYLEWFASVAGGAGRKKGERYLESDGKVFGAWISCWKRQVLAMARLQRREGQLRAFRSSCFGVCHGAHKIARATLACNFSSESVDQLCRNGSILQRAGIFKDRASVAYREGGLGVLPPENFWFRL